MAYNYIYYSIHKQQATGKVAETRGCSITRGTHAYYAPATVNAMYTDKYISVIACIYCTAYNILGDYYI